MLPIRLALLSAAFLGLGADSPIPWRSMAASDLSVGPLQHVPLLQIDRDFGDRDVDIVLDAWTSGGDREITEVRMWWLHMDDHGRRSPFGRGVRRHVRLRYDRRTQQSWRVTVAGDGKQFSFDIGMHRGRPAAFGTVISAGRTIERCRATKGRLNARRVLGIPVGLDNLVITCVDEHGRWHRAPIVMDSDSW